MSKMIEITVQPDGKISIQTLGFVGPSCGEASRFIEEALGQRLSEQRTAEFYQAQTVKQRQQQQS